MKGSSLLLVICIVLKSVLLDTDSGAPTFFGLVLGDFPLSSKRDSCAQPGLVSYRLAIFNPFACDVNVDVVEFSFCRLAVCSPLTPLCLCRARNSSSGVLSAALL